MKKDIAAQLELMRREPSFFRAQLVVDGSKSELVRYADVVEPWQREDADAIDPALRWLAGAPNAPEPHIKKFWLQRARGHSKTTDIAICLCYIVFAARKPINVIVGAADRDQARLVSESIRKVMELNPWLNEFINHTKYEITSKSSSVMIQILASDAASSYGHTPHLSIADEFTHWKNGDFWNSFASSAEKKNGVLIVACNAGVGKDWKFNVKETARTSDRWYYSARPGCVASWFTQSQLDEQRKMLPPSEYARLWENKWQETGGELVTLDEAMECRNEALSEQDQGMRGWSYIAAVDYAEKHDFTVGGVGHLFGDKLFIDRMDVEVPEPGKPVRTYFVRNWMRNMQDRFGNVRFILDPYQLVSVIEDLTDEGFDIERFDFGSGKGNYEIGIALRQGILHHKVEWYPGCGSVRRPWGMETLEDELASLIVTPTSGGKRWRFDHIQDNVHHDDRSFVLGVLMHACFRTHEDIGEIFDQAI